MTKQKEIVADEKIVNETEFFHLKGIGLHNWLALGWAFYWRNLVLCCVLMFLVFLSFIILLFLSGVETAVIIAGVISLIGLFFICSLSIQWFLNVKYEGFKITLVKSGSLEEINYSDLSFFDKFGMAWSIIWRYLAITLIGFVLTLCIKMFIGI